MFRVPTIACNVERAWEQSLCPCTHLLLLSKVFSLKVVDTPRRYVQSKVTQLRLSQLFHTIIHLGSLSCVRVCVCVCEVRLVCLIMPITGRMRIVFILELPTFCRDVKFRRSCNCINTPPHLPFSLTHAHKPSALPGQVSHLHSPR